MIEQLNANENNFVNTGNRLMILEIKKDGTALKRDMSVEDLFDADAYSGFIGTSYSVSVPFIEKYFSSYKDFSLIVGIPETVVQSKAAEFSNRILAKSITPEDIKTHLEEFDSFQNTQKEKILKKRWQFHYAVDQAIHSKVYLLRSEDGAHCRVIVGSANLSAQAFDNRYPQYEEILLFNDNEDVYDLFYHRLTDDLLPITSPYFAEGIAKYIKREKQQTISVKITEDESAIPVSFTSNKDNKTSVVPSLYFPPITEKAKDEIIENAIVDIMDDSREHIEQEILPEDVRNNRKEITPDQVNERIKKAEENFAYTLIRDSIAPRTKKPQTRQKIHESVKQNLEIIVKCDKSIEDMGQFKQPILIDRPEQRVSTENLFSTGLFEVGMNDKPVPYGKILAPNEIKESMQKINSLICSYEKYAKNCDIGYLKRIYETILYAFTGPFLWEIRGKVSSDPQSTAGLDVPNFLILGAAAGSGKSTLLTCLDKMTEIKGGTGPILMSKLIEAGGKYGKSNAIAYLKNYALGFNNESIRPIFVDEVDPGMFTDKKYMLPLIRDVANARQSGQKLTPIIMTTNADNFAMEPEMARRAYYVTFDHIINKSEESKDMIEDIQKEISSDLFQDFVCRIAERFTDANVVWAQYVHDDIANTSRLDFLYQTRKIFREYYHIAGMAVPEFFPDAPCFDYGSLGHTKWFKLYMQNMDYFTLRTIDHTQVLFLNMNKIFTNTGYEAVRNGDTAVSFAKLLPDSVKWHRKGEGSSGDNVTIMLDAHAFYEWAGIEKKFWKKHRFFQK